EKKGRVGRALDSLVSEGVIVSGGTVTHSVLSPFVRVNSYSEVTDSILLNNVNVGRHARIKRAIIDKNVDIPAKMEVGFDPEQDRRRGFTVTESGITVIPAGPRIREDGAPEPAEELTPGETCFVLRYFFMANWATMVRPHDRYYSLLAKRGMDVSHLDLEAVGRRFSVQELRDLQVWFNLSWFGWAARARLPVVE